MNDHWLCRTDVADIDPLAEETVGKPRVVDL
jgi:hypothetical protein